MTILAAAASMDDDECKKLHPERHGSVRPRRGMAIVDPASPNACGVSMLQSGWLEVLGGHAYMKILGIGEVASLFGCHGD